MGVSAPAAPVAASPRATRPRAGPADGVASAIVSAPLLAAVCALAAAVVAPGPEWAISATFLAGSALRRCGARVVVAASLVIAVAVTVTYLALARSDSLLLLPGRVRVMDIAPDTVDAVMLAFAGFSLGLARSIAGSVIVLAATSAWVYLGASEHSAYCMVRFELALAAAFVATAFRGFPLRLWPVAAAAAIAVSIRTATTTEALGVVLPVSVVSTSTVNAAASSLAACFAGRVARAIPASRPDGGTAQVVACQRRPWRVSGALALSILAALALYLGWVPSIALPSAIVRHSLQRDALAMAQALIVLVSFATQVGRGGVDAHGRLAPWLVFNVVAAAAAAIFVARTPSLRFETALLISASLVVWPLVVEFFVTAHAPTRETPAVALVVCALAFAGDAIACALVREPSGSTGHALATASPYFTLLALPLAFQTLARTTIATRSLLVGGLAAGAAMALVVALARPHGHGLSLALAAVWPLGAVLVVVARRFRSMTAIPLDHPVVADLDARA